MSLIALSRVNLLAGPGAAPAPAANRPVFATMAITQRGPNDASPFTISVAAHPSGTDTLNPPAAPVAAGPGPFGGFYKLTAFIAEGSNEEVTVTGDAEFLIPNNILDATFIVPVGWATFRHSFNNATVAFIIGVERAGQIFFSQRPTSALQANGASPGNISGGGQLDVQAGDKISAWVASDTGGIITTDNSNFTIHMLQDRS